MESTFPIEPIVGAVDIAPISAREQLRNPDLSESEKSELRKKLLLESSVYDADTITPLSSAKLKEKEKISFIESKLSLPDLLPRDRLTYENSLKEAKEKVSQLSEGINSWKDYAKNLSFEAKNSVFDRVNKFQTEVNPIKSAIDLVVQMREFFEQNGLIEVAKLVALFYTLYEQRSWKGALVALGTYALSCNIETIKGAIERLKSVVAPVIKYQAAEGVTVESESVPEGTSFWQVFTMATNWGKELWAAVAELVWQTLGPALLPPIVTGKQIGRAHV